MQRHRLAAMGYNSVSIHNEAATGSYKAMADWKLTYCTCGKELRRLISGIKKILEEFSTKGVSFQIVKTGIFAAGALFIFLTTLLTELYYITFSKAHKTIDLSYGKVDLAWLQRRS